ncbi:MAG: iron-containing alcohol dehydrogenase [Clostridiales bacterium]|nr:iron-containing alcohol dehydrogenase [Clostridiales bacterium]
MIYRFYMPTKVILGRNCIIENSGLFKTLGKKAIIVTGKGSAKKNGSGADVRKALEAEGIEYVVYDKVMSNPTIACAYEGASVARDSGADFVIAVGGGSPMDAGKAIALLAVQDIPEEQLFSWNYGRALPMAFVATTSGTGSEVTPYAILTNDREQTKSNMATDRIFPEVSFLDYAYTEGLSLTATINTAIDALSHSVEGMLSVKASVISDALASSGIKLFMECEGELGRALESGSISAISAQTREKLMHCSVLGGMVIAQTGTTVVHAMGYPLTYFRKIDHGRANGLLLGEYMKLVEAGNPELAGRVLGIAGIASAEGLKSMLDRLLGDKEKMEPVEIGSFTDITMKAKNLANCVVRPDMVEVKGIYEASFR